MGYVLHVQYAGRRMEECLDVRAILRIGSLGLAENVMPVAVGRDALKTRPARSAARR